MLEDDHGNAMWLRFHRRITLPVRVCLPLPQILPSARIQRGSLLRGWANDAMQNARKGIMLKTVLAILVYPFLVAGGASCVGLLAVFPNTAQRVHLRW